MRAFFRFPSLSFSFSLMSAVLKCAPWLLQRLCTSDLNFYDPDLELLVWSAWGVDA